ncbi:MAG TPA: hypothetical protein VHR45_22810 [Thermoanaerobaculia bacterium]|nr:hypothetical protein [Thermoanaerobaculia bacterium]
MTAARGGEPPVGSLGPWGVILWAGEKTPAELAEMYRYLSLDEIEDILAYYDEQREEVDRLIVRMRALGCEFRRRFPTRTFSDPGQRAFMEALSARFPDDDRLCRP